MPRVKAVSREEALEARRLLAERASQGELRLPEAVAEVRRTMGLTQEQFGKVFRLTRRQVSELETGAGNPTVETLNRIARAFGFTVGFVPRNMGTGSKP
ncbi:helix-turn-helix domain-containing protein [Skermanella rosea]|uniref:helix-turn-helix transcriptional regulator n=1 Tax=Skermanella rosea TaxID=1817965 RepID=UPI0019316335|nr:helix-turn-helix transcriptional regulator [Skermanella rosea]UEM01277.1 helix-turn-helix domain-containing protein [Skermanella rosea]